MSDCDEITENLIRLFVIHGFCSKASIVKLVEQIRINSQEMFTQTFFLYPKGIYLCESQSCAEPGGSHEAGAFFQFSHVGAGIQGPDPSSTPLPGTLPGSWTTSGTARNPTGAHTECLQDFPCLEVCD